MISRTIFFYIFQSRSLMQHFLSFSRSLLLLIALSFHSVFEGLAIGLQKDLGQLISLFLAVIAHKAVMAFSLGLNLAQANLNVKQYLISIIIFSIASPFGMAIGMGLSDMDQSLAGDIGNRYLWFNLFLLLNIAMAHFSQNFSLSRRKFYIYLVYLKNWLLLFLVK